MLQLDKTLFERVKYIVWDWNGTLLNDSRLSWTITSEFLRKHFDRDFSYDEYRSLYCHPIKSMYDEAGCQMDDETFREFSHRWVDVYNERVTDCSLQESAVEILGYLKEQGIKQIILSAYPHEDLIGIVKSYNIGDFFESMHGLPDRQAASKTAIGERWLKSSAVSQEQVLIIGDSVHDAEVAEHLGVQCVLISQGYQKKEQLDECDASVFDSLTRFYEFISNNN